MSWFAWSLVIFLTAMTGFLGGRYGLEWLLDRAECKRIPLERLADPALLPGELPRAGLLPPVCGQCGHEVGWCRCPCCQPFDLPGTLAAVYGPFPVDTGPLLILSEQAAANVALEREIRLRCAEAEAKIPPRWR